MGEAKVGLGSATKPPRHPDLAASALLTPSCSVSKGFNIFIDPPSPTGVSKNPDGGQRPPQNIQATNLLPQFEQVVATSYAPTDVGHTPTLRVQGNIPHDCNSLWVWNPAGNQHNDELSQMVPTQFVSVWVPAMAGFFEEEAYTTKCRGYLAIKLCWESRASQQLKLSLVIDHWIDEVIKWTGGVGQATPGVRCPQHRVGPCPVTLKRFRENFGARDKSKNWE